LRLISLLLIEEISVKTKKDPKLRRSSTEYREVTTMMDTARAPTFEEYRYDMRTLWEKEFSEPEKKGTGPGSPGPINFEQYIKESLQTLIWRKDEEVPIRFKKGLIDSHDAIANTEFLDILIGYNRRILTEASKESTNVIRPYNADGSLNLDG